MYGVSSMLTTLSSTKLLSGERIFMNRVQDNAECSLLYDPWLKLYAVEVDYDEPYVWCATNSPVVPIIDGCVAIGDVMYRLQ